MRVETIKKLLLSAVLGFFLLGIQAPSGAQEIKASCLTADGAVIKVNDVAYMRINFQSQFVGAYRDTGSGPDATSSTTDFYFRRNRLTISGQATETIDYNVKFEQSGPRRIGAVTVDQEPSSEFEVLESYVDADFDESFKVTVGKTKIPFSREVMEGCFSPLTMDRSLFINTPVQRTRDQGVIVWGNLFKSKFQYMAAVQEGQESGLAPQSAPRYTGRVHLALLDPENKFGYQGTYLGNKMVFTVGGAVQYEPGAVYSDVGKKTGAKDYNAWTADVFFEYPIGMSGTVTLSAAYLQTDFDKAYQGSDPDPSSINLDGEKKGWYGKAGYLFASQVGPGQFQPFVRYEQWDFASLNTVIAQRLTWYGLGFNYLINGQNLKLALEYAKTDFKYEENKDSQDFNTVTTLFQFGF